MYGEPPVGVDEVGAKLRKEWGIAEGTVAYLPLGYGSFHWTVGRHALHEWLITLDRVDDRPIAAAYEVAATLAADLPFVRGPLLNDNGDAVVALDGWWMSVWPWLEGRTSDRGTHQPEDLGAVVACLRALHSRETPPPVLSLTEDWDVPGLDGFLARLESDQLATGSGPYVAEVAERVDRNKDWILTEALRYRELAATVDTESEFVLTHGEPHPGNVVHTAAGISLIDWDTLRWAPKERDLWALGDAIDWRVEYGGHVSEDACEVYRLQWFLAEIAEFVTALLKADHVSPDLDVAFRETKRYLAV